MPRPSATPRDQPDARTRAPSVNESPAAHRNSDPAGPHRRKEVDSSHSPVKRALAARRRWLMAAGGVLLLLIVGLGWRLGRRTTSAPTPTTAPAADRTEASLQHAVLAAPTDPQARLALADHYHSQARPFEALWEYAEARHLAPSDPELLLRMANTLQAAEFGSMAILPLRAALRSHPDNLDLRRELAERYLSTTVPQRARAVLEERRAAVWQDADAMVVHGRACQAAGDMAGAVASFRRSIALKPDQHEAWYRLGRLHLSQGRVDEARDALYHALSALPSRPEHPFYVGMTFLQSSQRKDTERALGFFKDTLSVQSKYAPAYYQQGVALERLGRRREALSSYSYAVLADAGYAPPAQALGRGLAADGKKVEAHRHLGRYYDLVDEPAEAVREFRRMEQADPKSIQPALLMGQVLIRTGQSDRAVTITEAALKRRPDDVQLLERLAVLKINRGDRPYARRLLHHWLTLQPQAARPCWLLGRCDLGDLKYQEAVAWLERAIARQPANAHFHGFLGGAFLRMNTPESRPRAAEALARAVTMAPENAEYHDLYGQALQRLGRYEEARQQFLRALDAEPLRVASYTPLFQIATRLSHRGAAQWIPEMTRGVQQRVSTERLLWPLVWERPDDTAQRLKLARFLCSGGDLERARRQLEQILARRPDLVEAKQLLATVRGCLEVQ
jgi:tetratricopeptide (TPR) repeat protein